MSDDFEKELKEFLEGLSDREKNVLRERYGVGFEPGRDLKDAAAHFEFIRERIKEIEGRALARHGKPDSDPPSAA